MKFSLKQLMALVTAAAVVCAVMFALPAWLTVIALSGIIMLMPTVFIAGIIYGRGYSRAFSIGALWGGGVAPLVHIYFVYVCLVVVLQEDLAYIFDSADEMVGYVRVLAIVLIALNFSSGLVNLGIYWLFRRRNSMQSTVV